MEGDGTGLKSSGPDGPVTISSARPDGPATDSLTGPIRPNGAVVTFRGCEHFDMVKEAEGTGVLGISEDGSGDGKSVGAGPSPSL